MRVNGLQVGHYWLAINLAPDLAVLHDRMPVVIPAEAFDLWLDASRVDAATAAAMLAPPRRGFFEFHEVSPAVNRTANDDASLIAPVAGA